MLDKQTYREQVEKHAAKMKLDTIRMVAEVIAKIGYKPLQAELISCLLSCDNDERLNDEEANVGMELFEMLCETCGPNVVTMAQEL